VIDTTVTLPAIFQASALFAGVGASAWGIWRKIDKRQTEMQIATVRITDKLEFIEHQFGPNGGGLRQAVNEMSGKVDKIESRVNSMSTDLSSLAGRFDQHIVEQNK